jgi:hypothetical protein
MPGLKHKGPLETLMNSPASPMTRAGAEARKQSPSIHTYIKDATNPVSKKKEEEQRQQARLKKLKG